MAKKGTPRIDLTGLRFGTYTILRYTSTKDTDRPQYNSRTGSVIGAWIGRCDCGLERVLPLRYLRPRLTVSCECTRKDKFLGKKVGRLLVQDKEHRRLPCGKLVIYYLCQCDCGEKREVAASNIRAGTMSCGCFQKEAASTKKATHGEGGTNDKSRKPTKEYAAYMGAKARCNNHKGHAWRHYGGRGIRFRFKSFEEFLACVGRSPSPQHSLDRIDVDGDYVAGNVRWATKTSQGKNRRTRTCIVCPHCDGKIYGATATKSGISKTRSD